MALFLDENSESEEYAYWVESKGKAFSFHRAPVLFANRLKSIIEESKSPWVFTSATLTVEQSFEYFLEETGIKTDMEKVYPSPFDYDSSVRGLVIPTCRSQGDDQHTIALANGCMKS